MNGEDNIVDSGLPPLVPDAAQLRVAQQGVEFAADVVTKSARKLAEKTFELEQLAMFGEVEFEPAMLLPGDELRKNYTGEQAEKMEWRRNACIRMISYGVPAQDIAKDLHMNLRTVAAVAVNNGKMLAGFTDQFAKELLASAAGDIALADTKKHEASYKDLHIGAGIKMQNASALKVMAEISAPAVDIEADNGKLAGLREKIKLLKPTEQPTPQTV
jgi:hypothetical protein